MKFNKTPKLGVAYTAGDPPPLWLLEHLELVYEGSAEKPGTVRTEGEYRTINSRDWGKLGFETCAHTWFWFKQRHLAAMAQIHGAPIESLQLRAPRLGLILAHMEYMGKIAPFTPHIVDAINEPLNPDNAGPLIKPVPGPVDEVEQVTVEELGTILTLANEWAPSSMLCINEWGCETTEKRSTRFKQIIDGLITHPLFLKRKVMVGLQCHLTVGDEAFFEDALYPLLNYLAISDIPFRFSEVDIEDDGSPTGQQDTFRALWKAACRFGAEDLTFWHWRDLNHWKGDQKAGPCHEDGTPKGWFKDFLDGCL